MTEEDDGYPVKNLLLIMMGMLIASIGFMLVLSICKVTGHFVFDLHSFKADYEAYKAGVGDWLPYGFIFLFAGLFIIIAGLIIIKRMGLPVLGLIANITAIMLIIGVFINLCHSKFFDLLFIIYHTVPWP